jgi:hypothetical protein
LFSKKEEYNEIEENIVGTATKCHNKISQKNPVLKVSYIPEFFSVIYAKTEKHPFIGNRPKCPLENVLDEMSPDFGPLENVLRRKCPLKKCPLEMVLCHFVLRKNVLHYQNVFSIKQKEQLIIMLIQ